MELASKSYKIVHYLFEPVCGEIVVLHINLSRMKVNHKVIEKIPYSKIAVNANQITYNRSMKELKIMKRIKLF
jgi:hypothetical protein